MPKVTVIIPNYNHARFLEERIHSVLNQTYQDFEVLYLDDASTDNSNQVFAQFVDNKRIRAIYNPVNSGSPFKQWNKGIREAKGEYVWIAESDDSADERLLAKLVAQLDQHPTVGIAYCQSLNVDESNNILSSRENWTADLDEQRWKKDFVNNGKDECSRYLIRKNTIPNASAVLIRRTIYQRVGGADENMKICGDWMMWGKILLVSDIAFVAEPLNRYRSHHNTVRNNTEIGGLGLEEFIQVMHHISQNADVPENILEKAFDDITAYWLTCIVPHQIGLSRNLKIYRMLREMKPNLNYWVVRKVVIKSLKTVKQKLGFRTLPSES
jgi:glycosyltransferase involved in cell wall biosynthesis